MNEMIVIAEQSSIIYLMIEGTTYDVITEGMNLSRVYGVILHLTFGFIMLRTKL